MSRGPVWDQFGPYSTIPNTERIDSHRRQLPINAVFYQLYSKAGETNDTPDCFSKAA